MTDSQRRRPFGDQSTREGCHQAGRHIKRAHSWLLGSGERALSRPRLDQNGVLSSHAVKMAGSPNRLTDGSLGGSRRMSTSSRLPAGPVKAASPLP